nr:hypothetical protein [Rickettsia endosymbiont of Ceutorhynchus assimilis]
MQKNSLVSSFLNDAVPPRGRWNT